MYSISERQLRGHNKLQIKAITTCVRGWYMKIKQEIMRQKVKKQKKSQSRGNYLDIEILACGTVCSTEGMSCIVWNLCNKPKQKD